MLRNVIFICIFYIFVTFYTCESDILNEEWDVFVADRLQIVNDELGESIEEPEATPRQILKGLKANITLVPLLKNYTTGHAFKLFNITYLLLDTELYIIAPDTDEYLQKSELQLSRAGTNISVITSYEYEDNGFVFIGYYESYSDIFGLLPNKSNFQLIQTIQTTGYITDAALFANNNQLHLIICGILSDKYFHTFIYKWKGSHFDRARSPISGGMGSNKILTFSSDENTEIIIATEYYKDFPNLASKVIEFRDGEFKTQQKLPVHQYPLFLVTCIEDTERYLVLFQLTHITLFLWDGKEFHKWTNYDMPTNVDQVTVTYFNRIPIIFLARKTNLVAYYIKHRDSMRIMLNETYENEYKQIIDLRVMSNDTQKYILITALNNEDVVEVLFISLESKFFDEEQHEEKMELYDCLVKLKERLLDGVSDKDLSKRSISNNAVNTTKAPVVSETFNFPYPSNFEANINNNIQNIMFKINEIKPTIDDIHLNKAEVLHGKLIVKGRLSARKLTANDINLRKLNGISWTPEKWLSYTKPQTISGLYVIDDLRTKQLLVPNEGTIFSDMLLLNGNQNILGSVTVDSLETRKLYANKINNIPFNDIYLRSHPVKITGCKEFNNITADTIAIKLLNNEFASSTLKMFADSKSRNVNFVNNLNIKNLEIETFNQIHWNTFTDSAFKIGETNTITGNISIQNLKTAKLNTKTLSNRNVDDLFTISTDQEIGALMKFRNIDAANVFANKVNNVDVELEVATYSNSINEVKGPLTVRNLRIYGNLHLHGPESVKKIQENDVDRHEFELLQIYNKNVKILGNVYFQNLNTTDTALLFANSTAFSSETLNQYWLKRKQQVIPVHVEALAGISTPHLTTKYLNDVPLEQYMLNDAQEKAPVNFYFENATIQGNVHLNKNEFHNPNLRKINEEAVKLQGSYKIFGKKTYEGLLNIENLSATILDDVKLDSVVTVNTEEIFGNQRFENLVINGNFSSEIAHFQTVNGVNISEIYEKSILIDEPAIVEKMNFKTINATDIYLTTLNGEDFKEYMNSVYNLFGISAMKNITMTGNLTLSAVKNVSTINGIDMNDFLISKPGAEKGSVIFHGPVHVKEFEAILINDINFSSLCDNLFYRYWTQNVTGYHTFKQLNTRNINAPQINDLDISNLINVRDTNLQHLYVGGLQILESEFSKSVNADWMVCNVYEAAKKVQNPDSRVWKSIVISENVTLLDELSGLFQIVNNTFSLKKHNVVTGSVEFNNLYANFAFSKNHLNDVDIAEIAQDGLLKLGENQVVTGHKQFSKLTAAGASVLQNADISVINKIVIRKLNESIIYKKDINSMVIKGVKTFVEGFQTTNLQSELISGIAPEALVSTDNLQKIQYAAFNSLKIENNFNVDFINDYDFHQFLANRILKNHPETQEVFGTYYFNNVLLNGDSIIPEINTINMDEVVFDEGIQNINSSKRFMNDVYVLGNADIKIVNGYDISKLYEQAVLMDENSTFENSVQLNDVSEVTADISTQSINGVPVEDIKHMLDTGTPQLKVEIINDTIRQIRDMMQQDFKMVQKLPQKYMYLERSNVVQISLPNTVNAQTITTKGNVMVHIIGEESGDFCQLPLECSCPVQQTVQVTPEYSVLPFASKGIQRVFSYDDEEVAIHIISNSMSSSENCRTNQSMVINEATMIIWNTIIQNTSYTYDGVITGYISDVKYFTLNGHIYAVVARYYDPVINSHNIDTWVIRFSKEKDKIEDIKMLKTKGAWSLYILHTAKAIDLIVGNTFEDYNGGTDTGIYRFDAYKQEFNLLRTVRSSGCTSAAGVVLGEDSLIILAQKQGAVQVLKYNPSFDNYYFYQSFSLDSPVISVSSFYIGNFGVSDAYLCVVTKSNSFYLYTFQHLEGWKLTSNGKLDGLQSLVPFVLNEQPYLFAPSKKLSNLFAVVKHG